MPEPLALQLSSGKTNIPWQTSSQIKTTVKYYTLFKTAKSGVSGGRHIRVGNPERLQRVDDREPRRVEGRGCLNVMRFVDLAKSVKYQLYVRFDQARVISLWHY
jgi:hypothetical protein